MSTAGTCAYQLTSGCQSRCLIQYVLTILNTSSWPEGLCRDTCSTYNILIVVLLAIANNKIMLCNYSDNYLNGK